MPDLTLEPGSGAARIAEHLQKHLDLEMDRTQLAQHLGIAVGAVDKILQPGVDAGLITIANNADRGRVWRAGPRLKLASAEAPAKKERRGGKRVRLPALDAAAFPVRKDVPVPVPEMSRGGVTRYDALFDGLSADGMCRTGLPLQHRAAVTKASQTYMKYRPELAKASALLFRAEPGGQTFGIWRVARTDSVVRTIPAKASQSPRKAA